MYFDILHADILNHSSVTKLYKNNNVGYFMMVAETPLITCMNTRPK